MPGTVAPHVEMTSLQGLADLERLEGPWLDYMGAGEPENAATEMRLMLAHMVVLNKRVMSAMVLLFLRDALPGHCYLGSSN